MVELEYCLTPSNNRELLNLTNNDLEGRDFKSVVFHKDADSIILDFDDFNKGINDSTLTIRLTDVNGNKSIINLRASLYSTFRYSAKNGVQIKFYDNNNNLQIIRKKGDSIVSYSLTDDKWDYLANDAAFNEGSNSSTTLITSDGSSVHLCLKDVLHNSIFFSSRLLDAPVNGFYWFCSEIEYYCTNWEKKKLAVENGTDPNALDGVCSSKSVIPGFGGGYQVFYDAPCFAHTMAYPTNQLYYFTEVKNKNPLVLDEDYMVWESLGREYGVKVLNADFAPGTATYYAPVDEIPDGYSYVTIVHFADRTAVMSEVKEKP